ncbi:MAG: nucleotidyltransferase [Deltaproteobacteria bacterium RIFCSPLOWO2_02_FULL_44_10]|nr:MAG: nucleotidyltransferase [Deltaproteobacteria bacterium RIFCSPHIGHO2_02_FULL_44_16]OGQ46560.1 MAG: nucleotidyltransferase [Deltaproteobacteria bacterium RIFCSPLOWO2_02_FULL_44_10]
MNKKIRWQQRFTNLQHAFAQLEKGLAIITPNDVEKQGIIQSFEFTFELAWKTLKDYLESQNVTVQFPREVMKEAFHYQLIVDGDIWMDMLEKRNQMAHTYDEAAAERALTIIRKGYAPALSQLVGYFRQKMTS